jgi:hypothetical protein
LDLGAVLPDSPGVERIVTLTSQCDVAVEVFSLDYDAVYLTEEQMLSAVNIYDAHGMYRAAVRGVGEGLPSPVIACYRRILSDQEKERRRLEGAEEDNILGAFDSNEGSYFEKQEETPYLSPPLRIQPAPRDRGQNQDIIVSGLPLTGGTSISYKLGQRLHLLVRSVDSILLDIAATSSDFGVIARRCLYASTDPEKVDRKKEIEKAQQASEESKKHYLETAKKEKKKPKDLALEIPTSPETAAYEAVLRDEVLNIDNLTRLLTHRLSWLDAGQGIVLDGYNCLYLRSADVVLAVAGQLLYCSFACCEESI